MLPPVPSFLALTIEPVFRHSGKAGEAHPAIPRDGRRRKDVGLGVTCAERDDQTAATAPDHAVTVVRIEGLRGRSRKLWPVIDCADTPEEAAKGADAVLWKQFRELDPVAFGKVVRQKRVLDGRNALDRDKWEAAGWSYRALGRRHSA